MPSIPIAMCGKNPDHATKFAKQMLPEYEVIHHFQSTDEVFSGLPALMRGVAVKSSSGVGTNVNAESDDRKVPKAIFVGGGFSQEELKSMMTIPEGKGIPWLAPDPGQMGEVGAGGGPEKMMGHIVGRVKKCLREHGLVEGNEEGVEPGLWWT